MSWTKRQFVSAAFEEIGYAEYAFDLQPEQLQSALRRLDAMMATWNGLDIKLGYPLPDSPENSSLDDETYVPDKANQAVFQNLALVIAPIVGKVVSQETKGSARAAYMQLLNHATKPKEMQFPTTLPAGAGNKPWRWYDSPFVRKTDDGQVTPPSDEVEFRS